MKQNPACRFSLTISTVKFANRLANPSYDSGFLPKKKENINQQRIPQTKSGLSGCYSQKHLFIGQRFQEQQRLRPELNDNLKESHEKKKQQNTFKSKKVTRKNQAKPTIRALSLIKDFAPRALVKMSASCSLVGIHVSIVFFWYRLSLVIQKSRSV